MGWSWRKSTSIGPFRLNFSKSGIGISAGIRGARISTGSKGTYVHVGVGGFRYSCRLDDSPGKTNGLPVPLKTGAFHAKDSSNHVTEVVEPGQLIASSADELIEEIRRNSEKISLVSSVCCVSAVLLIIGFFSLMAESDHHSVSITFLGLGLAALVILPWAAWLDRRNFITRVNYEFDELGSKAHEGIVRLLAAIQRANNVWSVRVEDNHGDWKRNAGAGVSVERSLVRVGWGTPPRILTNVRVGHLVVSSTTLYFFPDRLLIYGPNGIRAIHYTDISLDPGSINFIETDGVPQDAVRVGTTWRFVNRDGGPDLRFKNNRQLPIMQYGVLAISSSSGLRLKLQLSRVDLADGTAALFRLIREAIEDLQSRGVAPTPTSGPLGSESGDLPPLVGPALNVAKVGIAALEYKWLAVLPEWAVPIIWGLVFVSPATAAIFVMVKGGNILTWSFVILSLLLAGCGVPILARDWRRYQSEQAVEQALERKTRFRDLVLNQASPQLL